MSKRIKEVIVRYGDKQSFIYGNALGKVVGELVRCKECKHRPVKEDVDGEDFGFNIIAPEGSNLCPCLVDDGWYSWMPKDNFFCGYGEREGE